MVLSSLDGRLRLPGATLEEMEEVLRSLFILGALLCFLGGCLVFGISALLLQAVHSRGPQTCDQQITCPRFAMGGSLVVARIGRLVHARVNKVRHRLASLMTVWA